MCHSLSNPELSGMLNILTIGFYHDNLILITKELFVYQMDQSKLNQNTNRLDLSNEIPYPLVKTFSNLKENDRFNLLYDNEQIHNAFLFTGPYLNNNNNNKMTKKPNKSNSMNVVSKIIMIPTLKDAYSAIEYIIDNNALEENSESLGYLKTNFFYDEFYISNFDRLELVQWRNDISLGQSSIAFAIINKSNYSPLSNHQIWYDLKRSFSPFYQVCIGKNQIIFIIPSRKHFCHIPMSTNISVAFMTTAYIFLFDLQYVYRIEKKIIFTGQSPFIQTKLAEFFVCPTAGMHYIINYINYINYFNI